MVFPCAQLSQNQTFLFSFSSTCGCTFTPSLPKLAPVPLATNPYFSLVPLTGLKEPEKCFFCFPFNVVVVPNPLE